MSETIPFENGFDIDFLAQRRPVALVLRHAERFPVRDLTNPLDALLTEQGKADSIDFGRDISGLAPLTLFHSPVERCRQTAEGIAHGVGEKGGTAELAGAADHLGGPYVKSTYDAVPRIVREYGMSRFLRTWFDGNLPGDDLLALPEAAELIFGYILRTLEDVETNTAMITHDWTIMILREYFLELPHEEVGFPGFLDGMAVYRTEEGLKAYYHGVEYTVPG
jgi:broad specificity phosphatase PhoE